MGTLLFLLRNSYFITPIAQLELRYAQLPLRARKASGIRIAPTEGGGKNYWVKSYFRREQLIFLI